MIWDTLAAIATAIGVAIAAWQIRESGKLAQSRFEDSLDVALPMTLRVGLTNGGDAEQKGVKLKPCA